MIVQAGCRKLLWNNPLQHHQNGQEDLFGEKISILGRLIEEQICHLHRSYVSDYHAKVPFYQQWAHNQEKVIFAACIKLCKLPIISQILMHSFLDLPVSARYLLTVVRSVPSYILKTQILISGWASTVTINSSLLRDEL